MDEERRSCALRLCFVRCAFGRRATKRAWALASSLMAVGMRVGLFRCVSLNLPHSLSLQFRVTSFRRLGNYTRLILLCQTIWLPVREQFRFVLRLALDPFSGAFLRGARIIVTNRG